MNLYRRISPYLYCLLSFAGVILIGSIFLTLPISYQSGTVPEYCDSLFLSISAVCTTGLSTFSQGLDTLLTPFGQIVVFILMLIGGLGFICLYYFFLTIFGYKISSSEKNMLIENLGNAAKFSEISKFVTRIVVISIIAIIAGTLLCLPVFVKGFGFGKGLWVSLFHTVSAFHNCGFDILGSTSLQAYSSNYYLLSITMILMFIGEIGFPVILDILNNIRKPRLSAYSKIVLITSTSLLIITSLGLYVTDNNCISFMDAVFTAFSCRMAGFSTFNLDNLSFAGKTLIEFNMFVGSSPMSTGAGVKTTSLFILLASLIAYLRRKKDIIVFKRKISREIVTKATAFVVLSFILVMVFGFTISLIEKYNGVVDNQVNIFFNCFSAFGTEGISPGNTVELLPVSKCLLGALIFIGRVGPLTVVTLFSSIANIKESSHVDYVEENILIG